MERKGVWERIAGIDSRLADGLLALVILIIEVGIYGSLPPPEPADNDLVVLLILAGTTTPLIWRRRAPLVVLSFVSVWVGLTGNPGYSPAAAVSLSIAAYTASAHRERSRELIAGLAVATIASMIIDLRATAGPVEIITGALSKVGLPIALGRAVFARRRWMARDRQLTAQKMIDAERARLARELHDVVAHAIGVMVVQAGGARSVLRQNPDQAEEALLSIEEAGRVGLSELRKLLEGGESADRAAPLSPQRGLQQLDELVEQMNTAGLDVHVTVHGSARPLPPGVDLSAYRIIQEALTNTLKHAGAARSQVRLDYHDDELGVEVTDDGSVRTESRPMDGGTGRGLIGMRERVNMLGGELQTGPRSGGGFEVRAKLPLSGS